MAALNQTAVSLIDVAKRTNPDGGIATDIAEMLTQDNEILLDAMWKESNLQTGHRMTVRTGFPTGTWRRFNEGVASSKSQTIQVEESCAMYEQRGTVDKDLAMLNGNTAEFRLSENVPHIESMNIDMATALFYGDASTNPERFNGLAVRYNSLSATYAPSQNIISASGSGSDNTSIWLVGWADKGVFCIYPKGSAAGIQHRVIQDASGDGCTDALDSNSRPYRAYVDHYQWKTGLAVKDWRYVVRICNIDVSNLVSESSAADLIKLMSRALDRIPNRAGVKLAFYANRTVYSMLKIQALNKSNQALSIEDALTQFGTTIQELRFLKVPCRICDVITNAETAVS